MARDGGMFYFREPGTAVVAGLDLVERSPAIYHQPTWAYTPALSSHKTETSTAGPSTWPLGSRRTHTPDR